MIHFNYDDRFINKVANWQSKLSHYLVIVQKEKRTTCIQNILTSSYTANLTIKNELSRSCPKFEFGDTSRDIFPYWDPINLPTNQQY